MAAIFAEQSGSCFNRDNSRSHTWTKLFLSYLNYSGGRSETKVIQTIFVTVFCNVWKALTMIWSCPTESHIRKHSHGSLWEAVTNVFCCSVWRTRWSLCSDFWVFLLMLNHPAVLFLTDELLPPRSPVVLILHLKMLIAKFWSLDPFYS